MKAKVWQETKSLTQIELETKLRELEEQQFRMKFRHSSAPLKNGILIRDTRRMIARVKTLLQQKRTSEVSR
ncbi:MAG: 50S ribosomal protein L29 [Elusimicrobia bacterium]|nr:50S ribosomal protein L29 [Elusimicrobiota bacterium]